MPTEAARQRWQLAVAAALNDHVLDSYETDRVREIVTAPSPPARG
jgi:hypothetical protein